MKKLLPLPLSVLAVGALAAVVVKPIEDLIATESQVGLPFRRIHIFNL